MKFIRTKFCVLVNATSFWCLTSTLHNDLRQHKKIHLVFIFYWFIYFLLFGFTWVGNTGPQSGSRGFFFKKYAAGLKIWLHSMNCEDGRSAGVVQHLGGKHPEAGSRGKQIFVSWPLLMPWLTHTNNISKAPLTDEINLQPENVPAISTIESHGLVHIRFKKDESLFTLLPVRIKV